MKTYTKQLLLLALVSAASGCFLFDQPAPEETIGSVHVDAVLAADTCGPGSFPGGPSMSYEVEIQRSGDTLHWLGPGGEVQGSFTSDTTFCIELNDLWHVRDADPWYGDPGCDMQRIERLCGTLEFEDAVDETGADIQQLIGLTARHEAFVAGTQTSNCSDQIGVSTGQYLTLPCQVAYELVGSPAFD